MNILLDIYLEKNLGDDLFLVSILKRYPYHQFYIFTQLDYSNFEKEYPNLHIVRLNKYFNYFIARMKLRALYKKIFIKKNSIAAIATIGGSIFIEYAGWETLYKERLSLWKYMKNQNKKVFIIGSNYGPYNSETFIEKYNHAFNYVEDICFRDKYSYDLFRHRTNVRQESDVIMSYDVTPYLVCEEENAIGISVINLTEREKLAPYQTLYIEKMVEIIEAATLKGKKVYLLSFCEREGDEVVSDSIIAQIKERKELVDTLFYRGDIDVFLSKFSRIKEIVACRFHSIVLSLLFDKDFYSLIYSKKSSDFILDSQLNNEMKKIEDIASLTPEGLHSSIDKGHNKERLVISGVKQYEGLDQFLGV